MIYADGAYAGNFELVRSILENRQTVALQIPKAIEILTANPDARTAIDSWFEETRAFRQTGPRRIPFGFLPGLSFMARTQVPSYVRKQLKLGITQPEILRVLRDWQERLREYVWALV